MTSRGYSGFTRTRSISIECGMWSPNSQRLSMTRDGSTIWNASSRISNRVREVSETERKVEVRYGSKKCKLTCSLYLAILHLALVVLGSCAIQTPCPDTALPVRFPDGARCVPKCRDEVECPLDFACS